MSDLRKLFLQWLAGKKRGDKKAIVFSFKFRPAFSNDRVEDTKRDCRIATSFDLLSKRQLEGVWGKVSLEGNRFLQAKMQALVILSLEYNVYIRCFQFTMHFVELYLS